MISTVQNLLRLSEFSPKFAGSVLQKIATSCPPTFLTRDTAADHGCGTSASHGVPAYVLAFAGTQCINPYRNSQAELYVKSQK